jgi:hypothetical protein
LCDDVIDLLMKKLELSIPDFILRRKFAIEKKEIQKNKQLQELLVVKGLDFDDNPFSLFKEVCV